MNAKKVIIDCDPGIDDALALMLALSSPEIQVEGITVVCGNVPAEQGTQNARKVLEWMGCPEIPVFLGARMPLVRDYVDAKDTHGEDGLGESYYPDIPGYHPNEDAVAFMAEKLAEAKEQGEPLWVIALGPMTNLAYLIRRYPWCLEGLAGVVSMGGSYKSHGNCSPVAEYNYWCDPHAAEEVYQAFCTLPALAQKMIHMVGLDVTRKIVLTPNILEYIRCLNPEMGEMIGKITRFYFDFHWKQEKIIGCVINDPLAVAYFLKPELCRGFQAYTTIVTDGICMGQSVVDAFDIWKKPKNSFVLTDTDASKFMAMFLERVIKVPEEETEETLRQIMGGDPL